MNPFLSMASDPYLTDPHQYAARHRDNSPQALVDCIRLDVEYLRGCRGSGCCTYTRGAA